MGTSFPSPPPLVRRDFLHEFLGVPVPFFSPYFMIGFFSRHVSTTTNSSVSSIPAVSSLQFPVHFFPFPPFFFTYFHQFFPDPLLHTHTILAFPPSFFYSPPGWRICPFWEEIGSVLANYLLAYHLASPFIFSPVLLKGWLDWMVSFLFCRRVNFG